MAKKTIKGTPIFLHESGFWYYPFSDGERRRIKSTKAPEADTQGALKAYSDFLADYEENRRPSASGSFNFEKLEKAYQFGREQHSIGMETIMPLIHHLDPRDKKTAAIVTKIFDGLIAGVGKDLRKMKRGKANGISASTHDKAMKYVRYMVKWGEENEDDDKRVYIPIHFLYQGYLKTKRKTPKRGNEATDFCPTWDQFTAMLEFSKTFKLKRELEFEKANPDKPERLTLAFRALSLLAFGGGQRRTRATLVQYGDNIKHLSNDPHIDYSEVKGVTNSEEKRGNPYFPLLPAPDLPLEYDLLETIRRAYRERINNHYLDGVTPDCTAYIMRVIYREVLGQHFGGTHTIRKMVATDLFDRKLVHLIPSVLGINIAMAEKHYIKRQPERAKIAAEELAKFNRERIKATKIVPLAGRRRG